MAHRILLLCVPAIAALAAYRWGFHENLHPDELVELLRTSGPWGPLLFVALFGGLEAFGVPGPLFIFTAIALWPPWQAFLLNWLGGIGAGVVGFGFARSVGRDWVAARMPERLRRYETRLAERGLRTVIWIRIAFFLFPPAHWILGLSQVRFGSFLLGTAIGLMPGMLLWTLVGAGTLQWLREQPLEVWLVIAAAVLGLLLARRLRARRANPGVAGPPA